MDSADDQRSDRELIARVRAGDAEAFRFLVVRHYPNTLRYAVRMLGNRQDAEEVAQDTFARAYRFLASWDGGRSFDGWLFGILVNCCRTSGARRTRTEDALVSYDVVEDASAEPGTAHDRDELQRALMRLPALHREALLMKYVDARTYEEIAQLTGTRVSALKMRVKRARAQLESMLRRQSDPA